MRETERKYLIKMPDADTLKAMPEYSEHNILQTYLEAENGVTRRVRKSVSGGNTVYMYNEKRRISPLTCNEDEHEISESEYKALLGEKEKNTETIIKLRRKFNYKGQIFEIDSYPFSEEIAVCETELPSEDTHAEFPDCLEVISEVSGGKAYSNHSIAKALFSGKKPF